MICFITSKIETICSKIPKCICLLDCYYENLVKKEVNLAGIKETHKVLCIGGGSIPYTAIKIAQLTNCNVTVIDIDFTAVKKAVKYIKDVGMDRKVKVIHGNGLDFCTNGFDVIHIALQVTPKDKILENIWENSPLGTKILIRKPKKNLNKFYSIVDERKFNKNIKYINHNHATITKTCLLVKSKENELDEKDSFNFYRNNICSSTIAVS
ncbi:Nicotianamine synthase protein [Alkalithermobacter thermoalcaliphilus JW-YL-7 = DSM 7308]|uniref:Nicotianamine synthase n=1 Tax=Alkalithermobacter thermoalcaliphilus JW-YL-7 = DSM 7308 TaxID=1121328 RepID=A0A150FNU9_CLOPD|nr:Nicotianamine synthase [[Clostridium] paradoxum JW-YL-7 = DSM 7308]SHK85478.1 Nicotianamine synthase protein [[Clostridium] paradoxum JW-YL-7 = DSM 7308]